MFNNIYSNYYKWNLHIRNKLRNFKFSKFAKKVENFQIDSIFLYKKLISLVKFIFVLVAKLNVRIYNTIHESQTKLKLNIRKSKTNWEFIKLQQNVKYRLF